MTLEEKGRLMFRILHVATAASWLGSVLCVLVLLHEAPLSGEDDLFGLLRAAAIISQRVLVPAGAFGTIFTGLALLLGAKKRERLKPWTLCNIAAALLMMTGILILSPWAGEELDAAGRTGMAVYAQPDMARRHVWREVFGIACALLLFFCFALALVRRTGRVSFPAKASGADTRKENRA